MSDPYTIILKWRFASKVRSIMTNAQHKALASYILAAGGAILATDAQLHWLPPWTAGAVLFLGACYQGIRHQSDTSVETPQTHSVPVQRDLRAEIPPAHFHEQNAGGEFVPSARWANEDIRALPAETPLPVESVGDDGLTEAQRRFVEEQIKQNG